MRQGPAGIRASRVVTHFAAPSTHGRERHLGLNRRAFALPAGGTGTRPFDATAGCLNLHDRRGLTPAHPRRAQSGTLRRDPSFSWTGATGAGRRTVPASHPAPWRD
jgi:hypothetical protein